MTKFLDDNGLLYFWGKVKGIIPTKVSDLTNDSGYITDISGKADKVSSATNNNFAALDANGNLKDSGHKHSDYLTSHQDISGKQDKITANGILKGNGSGGVSAAVAGTDYVIPSAIPTKVSDLTNDSGFQTSSDVSSAISTAIAGITGISFEIVQTLPSTGAAGTIYLVSHGGTGTNIYDEYIYVSNAWEKIGTTDIDLTGYWNSTNLVAITNAEIDTIVAS